MRQDRLLEIVGRIYQRPEVWHQEWWYNDCHTAFCVAGHAAVDSGMSTESCNDSQIRDRACLWLELNTRKPRDYLASEWLFAPGRTLPELIHFATTGERP